MIQLSLYHSVFNGLVTFNAQLFSSRQIVLASFQTLAFALQDTKAASKTPTIIFLFIIHFLKSVDLGVQNCTNKHDINVVFKIINTILERTKTRFALKLLVDAKWQKINLKLVLIITQRKKFGNLIVSGGRWALNLHALSFKSKTWQEIAQGVEFVCF